MTFTRTRFAAALLHGRATGAGRALAGTRTLQRSVSSPTRSHLNGFSTEPQRGRTPRRRGPSDTPPSYGWPYRVCGWGLEDRTPARTRSARRNSKARGLVPRPQPPDETTATRPSDAWRANAASAWVAGVLSSGPRGVPGGEARREGPWSSPKTTATSSGTRPQPHVVALGRLF